MEEKGDEQCCAEKYLLGTTLSGSQKGGNGVRTRNYYLNYGKLEHVRH